MESEVIYRVKDNPDFIKDQDNGAVLNTNTVKLREYKEKKKNTNMILGLQQEVTELKQLVKMMLEERKCQ